jgi:protoheme IX farnesyltransferase
VSNVASASPSLPRGGVATPGVLFRLSTLAGALAVGLALASAVLELGRSHWGIALVALPLLVGNLLLARIAYPALVPRSAGALVALLVAIALGGVVAWSGDATWAVVLHVGAAAVALGFASVVLAGAVRGEATPLASARDYLALTKPRIMTLLLLTGAAGMFVGAQGVPPLGLFAVTMLGLGLACGGASALNHVLDRDIDALMGSRTEKRPVAAGRVSPEQALEFGILLSAVSFALLASAVNVLTAVLALVGNLFYVLVYTRWLKRSTPQNIVIGGAAGAVPPLVGYAAATGSLALPALWLFLIVFLWTPPHFWALALMIKNAYAAAGVPMLPVVRGDRETARQIVLYSLVMVAFTVFVGIWLGALYTVAAIVLGAVFIALSLLLRRDLSRARAKVLFHYSLLYLALLFTAAALDPVLL